MLVVRPHDPRRRRRNALVVILLWLVSLALAIGALHLMQGQLAQVVDHSELIAAQKEIESLRQQNAALERAGQVARAANGDLQQTLRDDREQIAGLRADLAFFSRLTGGAGRREGLNVHGVRAQPTDKERVYTLTVTLTQNLKSGQVASGRLRVSIAGVREGKLATVPWNELAPDQDANGLAFSFKYFEQIKATVMLPAGLNPSRVRVEADAGGEMGRAEQDFAWSDALNAQEVSDVQQQP